MIRFALAGLLGRKLRALLTAIAIVLGVAMVAGTFVLTDSIDHAFNSIFTDVRKGSSVVVSGKPAFSLNAQSGLTPPPFDESLLPKVRALPDVAAAEPGVNGEAQLIGRNGKAIVHHGAPTLGFSIANGDSPFNPLTLIAGRWPHGDEVVIDRATSSKEKLGVGDVVGVQAEGPVNRLRVSGIVKFGSVATIGGATLSGFDLPTAQRLFRKEGKLDEIALAAKAGVSDARLLSEVRPLLPPTAQARSGAQQAHEDAKDTNTFISFLRGFLLAFGGIALFVGSFVIANSLSITIAQRTREFATVRTIGASRSQVLVSVIVEAFVVGALASLVGLFSGLGLARGLFWLFDRVGFSLPNSGLVFETRTIVVSLLVGVLVTVAASVRPAWRATRVPPIAAVREGATLPPSRLARFRVPASALLAALGFAALAWGLFRPGLGTRGVLVWMGLGALLVFVGVALLSERVVRPLAAVVAPPARWLLFVAWIGFLFLTPIGWTYLVYHAIRYRGLPTLLDRSSAAVLARDNAQRNPQRTASTAAALMIGLALVTLVAVLAAGITSTFRGAVDKLWGGADYAVTAQNNFSPIPVDVAQAAARAPGVEAVGNVRTGEVEAFRKTLFATAVDPPTAGIFRIDWSKGSTALLAKLGDRGAFVDKAYAKSHHLDVGSPVRVTFATGKTKQFVVRGIFDPPAGGSPFGRITISAATWDRFNPNPRNLYSFVRMRGGETDANLRALQQQLGSFPNAKAQTREKFIDNQIAPLNSILNILYVLLLLSVIVSLFGIVNTMVLTVFERTRELGMLRAIGMTQRQVRRMIRHESVITAVIGAALGIALGIVLGGLLVARVDFIEFSLPVAQLVIFALLSVVVGIIAAIFPARRAARLNVLQALQYE